MLRLSRIVLIRSVLLNILNSTGELRLDKGVSNLRLKDGSLLGEGWLEVSKGGELYKLQPERYQFANGEAVVDSVLKLGKRLLIKPKAIIVTDKTVEVVIAGVDYVNCVGYGIRVLKPKINKRFNRCGEYDRAAYKLKRE